MKRALAAAAIIAAALATTGCDDNKDPRKGRVTIDRSDCFTGHCYYDWKVCVGPDLYVRISDTTKDGEPVKFANDPECAPS